jgi:hypothetical protein
MINGTILENFEKYITQCMTTDCAGSSTNSVFPIIFENLYQNWS